MAWNKLIAVALGVVMLAVAPVAHADKQGDIDAVVEQGFRAFDANGDSFIRPSEAVAQGTMIFLSMDSNNDNAISADEFKKFSMGFGPLAEKYGTTAKYEAARTVIFNRWSGGRSRLTKGEMIQGMRNEFAKAASKVNATSTRVDLADFKKVRFITEMADAVK